MLHIVWEFVAKPECVAEFERHYGPEGTWARLFRRSPGYRGTELYRDRNEPGRYLLVDRWEDAGAFAAFKTKHLAEYEATDKACEALTQREVCVGQFEDLE
jgi:heme-degrading monooxygenase HmoA